LKLDIISESSEKQLLQYFCLISHNHRYDLAIGYTDHFYGKAMVTSLQSGKMVLLCQEDTYADDHWAEKLGIEKEDIPEFQEFFSLILQPRHFDEQY
jgi:hypothetical protein